MRVVKIIAGAPLAVGQVGGAGRIRPHRSGEPRDQAQGHAVRGPAGHRQTGRGQAIGGLSRRAGAAATSASRCTSPPPSPTTPASTSCRSPSSSTVRNRAFFEARGMAQYVAEPLGFVVEPGFQMSLQELRGRRGLLLRAARSRRLHLAALHGRSGRAGDAEPRGQALRHRPARHERHGRPAQGHAEAVRLQPDPVHRAAAESVHRARAQARVVRARIARPAQAGALQQFRARGAQAAQVLRGIGAPRGAERGAVQPRLASAADRCLRA